MIEVTATFVGKFPSLGYMPGQKYKLTVLAGSMTIINAGGTAGNCPYESLAAFLKNWDNIQHVEK